MNTSTGNGILISESVILSLHRRCAQGFQEPKHALSQGDCQPEDICMRPGTVRCIYWESAAGGVGLRCCSSGGHTHELSLGWDVLLSGLRNVGQCYCIKNHNL